MVPPIGETICHAVADDPATLRNRAKITSDILIPGENGWAYQQLGSGQGCPRHR